jgi:hypothetical protein
LEPRRSTTLWSTRGEDRGTRTHGKPNRENEGRPCPPVFEDGANPHLLGIYRPRVRSNPLTLHPNNQKWVEPIQVEPNTPTKHTIMFKKHITHNIISQ